ncbi:preprotein translocase subunit SecG [Desulfopila aestuarii]|uniref:Protein-export membrane protein SecG n=1 Tax=Desulfopila aestuarii DSM 18488 TaxID=1121416 RepID=A0A1M7YHC6_9BACT|nr:preprotein translocase subunit SecG [Desulfopila aestuarii]SHO51991.1 protein translocase subunit secG [Desulfopila aestuarii DSM 18488]
MDTLLTIAHVIVCLFLVGVVLLQHGKGADIGATFGGSSQSLFGTEGPLPLLNKITTAAAIIFMLTSVTLAYLSTEKSSSSVMKSVVKEQPIATEVAKPMATEDKVAPVAVPVQENAAPAAEGEQK